MLMAGERGSCWVLTVGRKAPLTVLSRTHIFKPLAQIKKQEKIMNPGLKKKKRKTSVRVINSVLINRSICL